MKSPRGVTPALAHSCANCAHRERGVFCEITAETVHALDASKGSRSYRAGESLFRAGEQPHGLYCLKKGNVKLESESPNGETHLLHLSEAGSLLGYRALLDGAKFHCSAVAATDVEVCFIPADVFMRVLERDPKIAITAMRKLSAETHELESRLCRATDLDAIERVAEALLMLQSKWPDRDWKRKELADWAGTTEETAIRALSQFKDEGLVRTDGRKILVDDRGGLMKRAGISV